ncbi:ABC transporter permease [Roseivirga sp. UBA838]|uniref:ABC transporter permease n=1 Tax=Roseivirga sp. UBA838 TaxID=1947393 RepID=UPI0025808243|nr:ABC transporter permease [Roseivirga sp. UBA838]|tara:strand:- start:10600 stop:11862 length:1263 start_codon:yes stop_codon:yes gene_type:complete
MRIGIFLKLMGESIRFALQVLTTNLLRTTLSLLGVTIGIMLIISVFTMVDSLEKNIKDSLDFLGSNVVTVDKFPYGTGPDPNYPWWKYFRRPNNSYSEFEFLQANLKNATAITIVGSASTTVRYKSSSLGGTDVWGITYQYKDVYEVEIAQGRYFTQQEIEGGRSVAIIGNEVAQTLFPNENPIGKDIKVRGYKVRVIGIMQREGESFIGTPSNDDRIYIPYKMFTKMYYIGRIFGINPSVAVKGLEDDIGLVELQNEMEGLLRKARGLRPKEESNFALNRPEAIAEALGGIFDVLGMAGWVIGGFAILVGGFGIMNIMFVSVQERTKLIGIQKSLGAKNYFILFQFLFESVFLCLLGGAVGVLIVFLLTFIPFGTLEVTLSAKNILLGVVVSSIIGVASGIIPSAKAARLDPVDAMRAA